MVHVSIKYTSGKWFSFCHLPAFDLLLLPIWDNSLSLLLCVCNSIIFRLELPIGGRSHPQFWAKTGQIPREYNLIHSSNIIADFKKATLYIKFSLVRLKATPDKKKRNSGGQALSSYLVLSVKQKFQSYAGNSDIEMVMLMLDCRVKSCGLISNTEQLEWPMAIFSLHFQKGIDQQNLEVVFFCQMSWI